MTSEKFEKPKRSWTDESKAERIAVGSVPSSKDKVSFSDKTSARTFVSKDIFCSRVDNLFNLMQLNKLVTIVYLIVTTLSFSASRYACPPPIAPKYTRQDPPPQRNYISLKKTNKFTSSSDGCSSLASSSQSSSRNVKVGQRKLLELCKCFAFHYVDIGKLMVLDVG